ncbi:MAG: ATP--guanido phosphotransferase, partial [Candidatus Omnitrophica bacterium]|nr:ATP--guanido phosphotransferase [Candidatus Omnitrophota bacterium]
MNLNDLLKHTSEWLKSTGPNSDIVMSSRVRLARNIDKLAFPSWANEKQSQKVLELVTEAVAKIDYFKNASLFKLAEVDSLDKQFLIERHLMSHEHAQKTDSKALVLEPEEIMSIMVNE